LTLLNEAALSSRHRKKLLKLLEEPGLAELAVMCAHVENQDTNLEQCVHFGDTDLFPLQTLVRHAPDAVFRGFWLAQTPDDREELVTDWYLDEGFRLGQKDTGISEADIPKQAELFRQSQVDQVLGRHSNPNLAAPALTALLGDKKRLRELREQLIAVTNRAAATPLLREQLQDIMHQPRIDALYAVCAIETPEANQPLQPLGDVQFAPLQTLARYGSDSAFFRYWSFDTHEQRFAYLMDWYLDEGVKFVDSKNPQGGLAKQAEAFRMTEFERAVAQHMRNSKLQDEKSDVQERPKPKSVAQQPSQTSALSQRKSIDKSVDASQKSSYGPVRPPLFRTPSRGNISQGERLAAVTAARAQAKEKASVPRSDHYEVITTELLGAALKNRNLADRMQQIFAANERNSARTQYALVCSSNTGAAARQSSEQRQKEEYKRIVGNPDTQRIVQYRPLNFVPLNTAQGERLSAKQLPDWLSSVRAANPDMRITVWRLNGRDETCDWADLYQIKALSL
jgi:hypothetical protein